MKSKKPRVVEIEWVDAASARGWCRVKEATDEDGGLSRVLSVGLLAAQDKQSVSISTSWDGGKFVDILSIPRAAITKMKIRKEQIDAQNCLVIALATPMTNGAECDY